MTQLVVDPALRSKLNGFAAQVELLDETGETLGYCVPTAEYKQLLYGSVKVPFSEEEIASRRAEKGGRPLAEVLTELAKQ